MKKLYLLITLISTFSFALNLTPSSFNGIINKKGIVLVKFWAPWCAPCRLLKPEFERAKELVGSRALMASYNVDLRGEALKKYNINTIPTMILFENGKEIDRHKSFLNSKDIAEWVLGYVPIK